MALKDNPTSTLNEVSKLVGIGTSRISEIVRNLKEEGRLERVGSNRDGYWKVK